MSLIMITAPAVEPISLAEAKAQCKVETDADDALISGMISAARAQAEHKLNRPLITQTWERVLDAFPEGAILLGLGPVQSIASVKYYDLAGVQQTLDPATYSLDSDSNDRAGYVLPSASASTWPDTLDAANALRVRFACGYGASGAAVPPDIIAWIKARVATLYKHRDETVVSTIVVQVPSGPLDSLLDQHILYT